MEQFKRNINIKDYYYSLVLIDKTGLNRHVLEYVLSLLVPKDDKLQPLVKYSIKDVSDRDSISFVPQNNSINISVSGIEDWLSNNIIPIKNNFEYDDLKILSNYFILFMLIHEIEHSYQYLMADGIVRCESDLLRQSYKMMYDILVKPNYCDFISQMKRVYHLRLYDENHDKYFLERNANIEACDIMMELSLLEKDLKMYKIFLYMRQSFMKLGYKNNNLGCIDETFRKIKLYKEYKRIYYSENLSEIEKTRYGFPISDKTRTMLLLKKI